MNKFVQILVIALVTSAVLNPACARQTKALPIPEIREPLDEKRALRLIVLATDLMFVRHYASDRQFKLKELEINASLEPFNEKMKELLVLRRTQMDECLKEASAVQTNFLTAYDQLNAARYDISDYSAVYNYAKKNLTQFQRKDLLQAGELKAYEESRPRGFTFRSNCIDDGVAPKVKEKTDFISPYAQTKK